MKTVFLLTISIVITSCVFLRGKDDSLTFERRPYQGKKLRMNGFYYTGEMEEGEVVTVYFFFRNGVMVSLGSIDADKLETVEAMVQDTIHESRLKEVKFVWGLFKIENDHISFEKWYPVGGAYYTYIREGEILNDTTFRILKSMRSDGTEISSEDVLYHFRESNHKPDSISQFIK